MSRITDFGQIPEFPSANGCVARESRRAMHTPESVPDPAVPRYVVRRRRGRTIALSVRADGTVEVRAPRHSGRAEIEALIADHTDWIEARRRELRERAERRRDRQLDEGHLVPFLGEDLRLHLVPVASAGCSVQELRDSELVVRVPAGLEPESRRAAVREAVGEWLLERARDVIHECHREAARRVGDAARSIVIKEMRSQWGSCGPDRKMSVSWRLVMAPRRVIDYVLVHELTHIRIADHSDRFWARVSEACPHWRESRDWLRAHGDDLEL